MKILTAYDPRVKNAGFKAKYDIERIVNSLYPDCKCVTITYKDKPHGIVMSLLYGIRRVLLFEANIRKGETIILQHPLTTRKSSIRKAGKKICIVHDLDGLRGATEEVGQAQIEFIKEFDVVISHNCSMTKELIRSGINKRHIIDLELFDYLCRDDNTRKNTFDSKRPKVVYSGNLSKEKCPFIRQLDGKKIKFDINLYGNGLNGKIAEDGRMHKMGCFSPDAPGEIEGDLGLVWDGDMSGFVDENTTKYYNKFNNPHKLSCYIAAGIPVIVWRKAAVAKFVVENNIGYLIDEIYDINNLDFSDYDTKFNNVQKMSKRVRKGYYTKKAIEKALQQ